MVRDQVILYAEPSERSIALRKEIEKLGLAVNLIFCASGPGIPCVESKLTTIRGYENIRQFFATQIVSA